MGKKEEYTEQFEKLLLPILEQNAFELYDTEYVKEGSEYYLRAYIDKPGGITIDDCELVSRAVSDRLDEKDFIPEAYILEVSSPGLGRKLTKDRHFEKSMGEAVELRLFQGLPVLQKGKEVLVKEWEGILIAYDAETVTLEDAEGKPVSYDRKNIALIRLKLDVSGSGY